MSAFGNQVVTFVSVTENTSDRDRYNKPTLLRTGTDVPGCRFRPIVSTGLSRASSQEKIDLGDIVFDTWKCTAPPVEAVLNAKSSDEVVVDGISYQITGVVKVFTDFSGRPFKCTIICDRSIA